MNPLTLASNVPSPTINALLDYLSREQIVPGVIQSLFRLPSIPEILKLLYQELYLRLFCLCYRLRYPVKADGARPCLYT